MSIYSSTRALDSEMVELGEISRYRLKDQTFSTENNECCCFKEYKFRVWQILLIVFIVLVMIALLCLIIAMFGPGNTDLKYSAVVATDVPGVVNGGKQFDLFRNQCLLCLVLSRIVEQLILRYNRYSKHEQLPV